MVKNSLPLLIALFCATTVVAQEHGEHHHAGGMSWQEKIARQPNLAVTVNFDRQGRLWRAGVKEGQVIVDTSTDLGKTFSPAVSVNPAPESIGADGDSRPKIAIAADGTVYVSYTRQLNKPYSGDIRFSRSIDAGKHFSEPVTVNDNHDIIGHRFDALLLDNQDHIHLLWLDKRDSDTAKQQGQNYSGSALYYAKSTDRGASFSKNQKLIDHTCECCRIAVALNVDGIPVAMWRHIYDHSERDHALLRLDGKDQPHRVTFDHWQVEACPHHGPALAISRNGDWHLAWFNNAPQAQGLFYAASHDGGKTYTAPLAIGNRTAQAGHAAMLALGDSVFLAWKEFDGKHAQIRGMHSTDSGATWSTAVTLAQTDDASDHPQLVSHAGKVYLSWNTLQSGYQFLPFEEK